MEAIDDVLRWFWSAVKAQHAYGNWRATVLAANSQLAPFQPQLLILFILIPLDQPGRRWVKAKKLNK